MTWLTTPGLLVMFGSDAAVAKHVGSRCGAVPGGRRISTEGLRAAHIIEWLRALLPAIGEEDR